MDMSVKFFGGSLAGRSQSPVNEEELEELGYRVTLKTGPHLGELPFCCATPVAWSADEAHRAIKLEIQAANLGRRGKKSV